MKGWKRVFGITLMCVVGTTLWVLLWAARHTETPIPWFIWFLVLLVYGVQLYWLGYAKRAAEKE